MEGRVARRGGRRLLLGKLLASAAMSLSSVSGLANSLRLRRLGRTLERSHE